MAKYIFVTGGVVSGLGKGATVGSLGRLLKSRGLKVAIQKLEPYINVDPGTMDPYEHGEVFVTDDGAETDQDIGTYERFTDENMSELSNLTCGKVYFDVITKERSHGYKGKTVQVIPHITDGIKNFIYSTAESTGADVLISEIGGTTGDIEGQPFIEAIRQISLESGRENCLFIHVLLVPYLKFTGEHKSKPAQHSVHGLQGMGISPDIIITRSDEKLDRELINKLSLFCNVKPDCVIENLTLGCLYEIPLMLHENGLDTIVCRELNLKTSEPDLDGWRNLVKRMKSTDGNKNIKIAVVGKYVRLRDAYHSLSEAVSHAGFAMGANITIEWIDSEKDINDKNASQILKDIHGIIVPSGFGSRGISGKLAACRYARENNVPYLGLGLGMQVAAIEFARNVCGLADADSFEFNKTAEHTVINSVQKKKNIKEIDLPMRKGTYPCKIKSGTLM
ncbi:MAG: CTP synthase, partial [Oscillospiraceae bacterium]|nr:CTP synthase [Oscillospiraceae bacterium]